MSMGEGIWGDREDEMEGERRERRGSGSRGRRLLVVAVTADLDMYLRYLRDDVAMTVEVMEVMEAGEVCKVCEVCERRGPLARKSRLRMVWVVPGPEGEAVALRVMVNRAWPMLKEGVCLCKKESYVCNEERCVSGV